MIRMTPTRCLGAAARFALAVIILNNGPEPASAEDSGRISDPNFHTWYMYSGDHPFNEGPWGLHFDGQIRRQGIVEKWHQLVLRPGINYAVTDKVLATLGYAFTKSYPYGDFPSEFTTPEHRIWQQLLLPQAVGRVALKHRLRFEQRWVGVKVADEAGKGRLDRYSYRNRFRYFLSGVIPLRKDSEGNNRYYLALYNEFMINFGSEVQNNVFDQNRAYGALGIRVGELGNLELGYLQQTVQQSNGRVFEYNHTLRVALFSTLPFGI